MVPAFCRSAVLIHAINSTPKLATAFASCMSCVKVIELSGKRVSDQAFFPVVINVGTHVSERSIFLEYVYGF